MPRLLVLDGPNLNLLGTREPEIYGSESLSDLHDRCRGWGAEVGWDVVTHQSNHEGELIDRIHERDVDGIVLNAGAFTHTSYALHDAIVGVAVPTVEVHISNVEEREPWRRTSLIRPACVHAIYGRGVDGYRWAIRHLAHRAEWPTSRIAYGPDPDQFLDLRRPTHDSPSDAVVLFHGGFWRHQWTRDTTEGIAIDLARRGFTVANAEYRRVGAGGGWPATVDDAVAAVARVTAMQGVGSVVVIGHSAGGHLAVHAAARHHLPVVSMAGVLDLRFGLTTDPASEAIEAFLAGTGADEASALGVAPTRSTALVHGTADIPVPVDHSRSYAATHPGATLVELDGTGHFEFLERTSAAWRTVVELVETATEGDAPREIPDRAGLEDREDRP